MGILSIEPFKIIAIFSQNVIENAYQNIAAPQLLFI